MSNRLIRALGDRSFKVRLQAAILLGNHKVKRAAPALRKAVDDEHDAVRAAAILALGKIGDDESRGKFAYLLGHKSKLIARSAEKGLVLLDKALGQTPFYLVSIARPRLPKGVPTSRGFRMMRKIEKKLRSTRGLVLSAGEEKALQGDELQAHLAKRKLTGMQLQPKLVKLSLQVDEGRTTVLGKVSIMVVTLTKKKMEFSAGGEADAWIDDTDVDEEDRADLENTVLDASSEAAVTQVLEYLAKR